MKIKITNTQIDKVFLIITTLILGAQLFNLIGLSLKVSAPRSIIAANDDDAGVGIAVAVKSKWWNDNTFRAYGNFYYRVAHSLEDLVPISDNSHLLNKKELKDKGNHFYLLLLNIISLYFAIYLLSKLITNVLHWQLLFITSLMALMNNNLTWNHFFLRPHPEFFFSALAATSFYLTLKYLSFPKNKVYFKNAAISWGLATAVKMTSLLFAPGVLIVLISNFKKQTLIKISKFAGWALAAYFLIGFPQNFIIHKTLRTLMSIGKYARPADSKSIFLWLERFYEQGALLFIFVLIFTFIFKAKESWNKKSKKAIFLILIPVLVLLTRNSLLSTAHYTISFILCSLFILSYYISAISFIPIKKIQYLTAILVLLSIRLTIGYSPKSLNLTKVKLTSCRPTYFNILKKVKKYIHTKSRILADPYSPVDDRDRQDFIRKLWNHTPSNITRNTELIVLNTGFYHRYITGESPSDYVKKDIPNWPSVRKYYLLFNKKDEFIDRYNNHWKKTLNKCSLEVWEKKA